MAENLIINRGYGVINERGELVDWRPNLPYVSEKDALAKASRLAQETGMTFYVILILAKIYPAPASVDKDWEDTA